MSESKFLAELVPQAGLAQYFLIGGRPVSILVNDVGLSEQVAEYFAPFASEPRDDAMKVYGLHGVEAYVNQDLIKVLPHHTGRPKEAVYDADGVRIILKTRTGIVHYAWGTSYFAVGDLEENPRQLLNLVSSALSYQLRADGYIAIHAAGISRAGRGVAIAGNSGSGKSTAALRLVDQGFDFVSNDRVFLTRSGEDAAMSGVPKWPRVNPGTLLAIENLTPLMSPEDTAKYSAMPPGELWGIEHKHDVRVDEIYGLERVALASRLDAIYALAWKHGAGEPSMRRAEPAEMREALGPYFKSGLYDPSDGELPSAERFADLIGDVPVTVVTGGIEMDWLGEQVTAHYTAQTAAQVG